MELNTWILGKMFVGVSAWYRICTAKVKILCRGSSVGRSKMCIRDSRWGVLLVLIAAVAIFGIYGPGYDAQQFIYFQF